MKELEQWAQAHQVCLEQCMWPNCFAIGRHSAWVTIDFKHRRYTLGYSRPVFSNPESSSFVGKGWRERLLDCALDCLLEVCK